MLTKFFFACAILVVLILASSAETEAQEFRLYRLPAKYRSEELQAINLAKLRPGPTPLLSESDVLRYDADQHRIILDYFATERLRRMKIPKRGLPFAVFAGNEAIYVGALFDGYSMAEFKGVAVDVAPLGQYPPSLLFELDYPPLAPKNPANDPRGDQRLLKSFEKAGKLYREVWLDAVCKNARATGKRRLSYVFEFEILSVAKGVFPDKTISFEVFADERSSGLLDLLKEKSGTDDSSRVRLKFQRQVSKTQPVMWYQDFEVLE